MYAGAVRATEDIHGPLPSAGRFLALRPRPGQEPVAGLETARDADGRVRGGHLLSGRARTTAKAVLPAPTDLAFGRAPCPLSGHRKLTIVRAAPIMDRQAMDRPVAEYMP